jgi:site-specific recombinase XerD
MKSLFRRPAYLKRHTEAPLLEERERFLASLLKEGLPKPVVQNVACFVLRASKTLRLGTYRVVDDAKIDRAIIRIWGHKLLAKSVFEGCRSAYAFRSAVKRWLRFNGVMRTGKPRGRPLPRKLRIYETYLKSRHFSSCTVDSQVGKALGFLRWLSAEQIALSRISLNDVDRFMSSKRLCGWAPATLADLAYSVRYFLRYSEAQGWSRAGISDGVRGPNRRLYPPTPQARKWSEVKRLLRSVRGDDIASLRAKAALLIIATYALRISEMARLEVSDFDFSKMTLSLRRSKNGQLQRYPLCENVAKAVQKYIKFRRKNCDHLFLTIKTPYRPADRKAFYAITHYRLAKLGITHGKRGPHAIRHARAMELLRKGVSLSQIGDFLGHRDCESPLVYARYTVESLRPVADFSLGRLL